ncbi:MAG: hypothetical protein PF487_04940 [Bacteroidales bacterium]|jgi:hypothetical protein|nr:hypothetical protein [Bacteroidales bacterium]
MKKILKKILLWIYLKIHSIMFAISVALFNTEQEILKADPNNVSERNSHTQRMRSRNQLLEKFYAGQTDQKYVQEYYEVLKKADKFIRTATPHQMAVAADKYGTSYGMKDRYGRRYEHYGFFDNKHKHAGKTLGDVLVQEFEERRTKDDDLEILYIFNNNPIEVGLAKVFDFVEKKENSEEIEVLDLENHSKQFKFPIKIERENKDAINKIEELTEFLHVKKIGFEYRQLEFFVPLKFKTSEIKDESDIFKELINIKAIFIYDEYGQLMSFGINEFNKRIIYNDTHEVFKFQGIEMETWGLKT